MKSDDDHDILGRAHFSLACNAEDSRNSLSFSHVFLEKNSNSVEMLCKLGRHYKQQTISGSFF